MRVFLAGDVMTGRGIDQILPHPVNPVLAEPIVRDAREYVRLAEQVNGPIARPARFDYVWGDALDELRRANPDAKVVNLETSVTSGGQPWPDKTVHYRMHPANVECLTAASLDCCCLANNHVLDWGHAAFAETLWALRQARLTLAGAGRNAAEAAAPAVLDLPGRRRLLVAALGSTTSGIPAAWAATADRPGVDLLPDFAPKTADGVADRLRRAKRPGDVAVASIHWGGNWGYGVPAEQVAFAHRLIDGGVDVVHGHSSHHPRPIEVYRDRPILYGCGDFINDYEGIAGYAEFRSELRLMYLVDLDGQGRLTDLRAVPMRARRFRLERAPAADGKWLRDTLGREGKRFGTRMESGDNGALVLRWQ